MTELYDFFSAVSAERLATSGFLPAAILPGVQSGRYEGSQSACDKSRVPPLPAPLSPSMKLALIYRSCSVRCFMVVFPVLEYFC